MALHFTESELAARRDELTGLLQASGVTVDHACGRSMRFQQLNDPFGSLAGMDDQRFIEHGCQPDMLDEDRFLALYIQARHEKIKPAFTYGHAFPARKPIGQGCQIGIAVFHQEHRVQTVARVESRKAGRQFG